MNDNRTPDSIFCAAIEIESSTDRAAYVAEACGDDRGLRDHVEQLLQAHDQASRFMLDADETIDSTATTEGTRIGPYKLRERLGEGGMGVVWAAEQVESVHRKVALKVIKPGMDTDAVVARFEAERQALAMMDHPNIAHVLDAGTTEQGRPYFVMELIRGIPITEYCDTNKLGIPERLKLFMQVCKAVQHAHQKGIIHRDIKPTNVLVTLHDGEPVPKVIDFGVAKALNQKLTDKTIYTRVHQAIGTLAYMSPEQAELSGLDVDTRADIYGLGVLLYELLTGTTPFERRRLHEAAYHEACRIIRDEDPPRPSIRLSTLGETATAVSTNRRSDVAKLGAIFRGELDWIVMKAMEKDRTRRYETAVGFAADLERYLIDEPVEAKPPTPGYRLGKFVRRNKGPVLAGTLLGVSLIVGIAATLLATRWAFEERRRALETAGELLRSNQELIAAKNELEAKQVALKGALEGLSQAAYKSAIQAALVGDELTVRRSLEILREADRHEKSTSAQIAVVEALLAYTLGEFEEAVDRCQYVLAASPQDFVAAAILAKSSIHAGYDEDFPIHLYRLRDLTAVTNEDHLMMAAVEIMNDPKRALRALDSISDKLHSPLELTIRAEAVVHMALETGNRAHCDEAIQMFKHVDLISGTNCNTMSHQLLAFAYAINNAKIEGQVEDIERYELIATPIEARLRERFPYDAGASYCRWLYHSAVGNREAAWDAIKSVGQDSGSYTLFMAADRLQNVADPGEALRQFNAAAGDAADNYAVISRIHLLQLSPDNEGTVRSLIATLLHSENPAFIRKHAIYALCLCGDTAQVRLQAELLRSSVPKSQLFERLGESDAIEYLAGEIQDRNELIQRAGTSRVRQSAAYFTLAMMALSNGDRETARNEFQNCIDTSAIAFFEYELAEAYLARLNDDDVRTDDGS